MQFCETCMQPFCLIFTVMFSIASTQCISSQEDYTLIESWILKVILLIRENRWLTALVHVEFLKWVFCITISLYNFPFLTILLCLVWLRQREFLYFYVKKTFMEVGIFIFTVLTSFYKMMLLRSPFTSMTIILNQIIFLFLTIITRDPPYWKHMELVNTLYCKPGRTCMQIYKRKDVSNCISYALVSVVSLYNWCCARQRHLNWVWNGTDLGRGKSR